MQPLLALQVAVLLSPTCSSHADAREQVASQRSPQLRLQVLSWSQEIRQSFPQVCAQLLTEEQDDWQPSSQVIAHSGPSLQPS